MERQREEPQQQQEQPPQNPLKCPRCGSPDTKFRYFNNNSPAQPRHYCKTCKRQWTVGGNLRNIPIGGKTRNGKPTKISPSKGGSPISEPPQPWASFGETHRQSSQSLTPMTTVASQNFDTTISQPVTNLPVSPLDAYYFNDETSCFDAIQSLIQPEINSQHVNAGNHFVNAGANVTIPQEWNVQNMPSQQAAQQEIPRNMESYQIHNEAINAPPHPYHLYSNSVVQPAWPMHLLPQDTANDFSFTTSDAFLWNNFSGDATNTEDTTSVNVDEWLNFPGDDDPP